VNIRLVEDDARVADFIGRGMRSEGWQVSIATDGEAALAMLDT